MQENLVIVESPAKAKTIEKFLGKDYKVMSSYGHIRDLKKKEISVDLNSLEPHYEIPEEKKKLVGELKKNAKEAMKEEATRCNMFYVNERWLGGMLTNFKTIQTRIARLRKLEAMEADGTFDLLPKKEVISLKHEMEKLTKYLGGIKDMKKLPGAMFIVDPRKEHIAVLEAHKLNIPIVATVDTNCDPDEIDHVIPANDDAIRAVKLLTAKMADAVLEGRQGMQTEEAAAEEAPATEEAE